MSCVYNLCSFVFVHRQGTGKNKLVDRLLFLLNSEREYMQLHRDTTLQALTQALAVHDGHIVFEDSPLVRAAVEGRVLVRALYIYLKQR